MQTVEDMPKIGVILAKAAKYDEAAARKTREVLSMLDMPLAAGDRVLVKPNLLRADILTCTNAMIVAESCRWLLDKGCKVTVGDSPGFGTAKGIAKFIGLEDALARAGCGEAPVISLDSPVKRPLSLGGEIGLSRHALEADYILNIPKLKAHTQMRVTGAVKNLFGCISGVRKAFAHSQYGDKEQGGVQMFPSLVADILNHLPPVWSLMDAVVAMHVRGPSGGKEFHSRLLAASANPVALDTAVYSLLGVAPEELPLWAELQRRRAVGAFLEEIVPYGEPVREFDLSSFMLPMNLAPPDLQPGAAHGKHHKTPVGGLRDAKRVSPQASPPSPFFIAQPALHARPRQRGTVRVRIPRLPVFSYGRIDRVCSFRQMVKITITYLCCTFSKIIFRVF